MYAPRGSSVADRLTLRTDRSAGPDGCWPFIGTSDNDGYGLMEIAGVRKGAHVWALIEASGEDRSAADFSLHSCDNPPCCNPKHLRWGTGSDNMRDMHERGRHTKRGHKLTDAQVLDIRARQRQTLKAIAAEFGVSFALIHQIRKGTIWQRLLPTQPER